MQRATVYFIHPPDDEPDANRSEWTHRANLEFRDHGVVMDWGNWGNEDETFFPYSNIARIDFGPCGCTRCPEAQQRQG